MKNRFRRGDQLCLMSPKGNISLTLEALENRHGDAIDTAPGSGHVVRIPRPADLTDAGYCMITRQL